MPYLKKIIIRNFRNITLQEAEFSPNVNCISGGNGEGKTNLLDAIHYLSMTKSAFGGTDKSNVRHGESSFEIAGTYSLQGERTAKFAIKAGDDSSKKLTRDDKAYEKISDHIGVLPVVMVSPSDISLVSESGDERRRFVNSVISQMDREYLNATVSYNRLLMQRNRLLKSETVQEPLLDAIDTKLSGYADTIFASRRDFCDRMRPVVQKHYATISGGKETVGLDYVSDLFKGPLKNVLSRNRGRDIMFKYTTCGMQKDDFIFSMDGFPIRRCGSQGQQKSFLVALKFAQYEFMKERLGITPILLLDDLFDKLDMTRVQNLLKMVAGNDFGQIFITDSNKIRMKGIVDGITSDSTYFETAGGVFSKAE